MSKLSGIKDLDREILSKIDDSELLKACSIDKYTWNNICDDAFLRRRLLLKYPEIEIYKKKEENWKQFFLKAIRYIALMKEKFDYDYFFGDFLKQYILLDSYNDKNKLLIESAANGEIALVNLIFLKKRVLMKYKNEALENASKNGHLEVVKYLVKQGANIHYKLDAPLRGASENGHLETVKYLVEAGADIHSKNDFALRWAGINGHLEVVKYLKSKM